MVFSGLDEDNYRLASFFYYYNFHLALIEFFFFGLFFFFQAEDGIRDLIVTEFRRVLFRSANEQTPMPVGGVVPGFSEALQLMQKGGEYRIWIPSELAYGEASPSPNLPPNSLLIFDVTLMDFISQAQMEELRQQVQQQGGMPGGMPPGL